MNKSELAAIQHLRWVIKIYLATVPDDQVYYCPRCVGDLESQHHHICRMRHALSCTSGYEGKIDESKTDIS